MEEYKAKTPAQIKVKTKVLPFGLQKLVNVEGLDSWTVKKNKRALTLGGNNLSLLIAGDIQPRPSQGGPSNNLVNYKLINENIETTFTKELDLGLFEIITGPTYAVRTYKRV